jgi:uncharacterized membrane protein YgcG
MKFFQKRSVAVTVMVLVILASIVWGQYKKPAPLPEVRYETWICDDAKLLSGDTERTLTQYNDSWNDSYYALCAVATVKSVRGWDLDEYTMALGENWGLGTKDLLLVLIDAADGPTWYLNGGTDILGEMTDAEEKRLRSALDGAVYGGRWDDAATGAFAVIDEIYRAHYSLFGTGSGYSSGDGSNDWRDATSARSVLVKFLLVLLAVFILWLLLDRLRYKRYRRRSAMQDAGAQAVRYLPIFWGRSQYKPRPPANHTGYGSHGSSHLSGGGSGSGVKPSSTRPSGGFGSLGGFGGGSRGGFGGRR